MVVHETAMQPGLEPVWSRQPISVVVVSGQAVFRSGLSRLLDEDARIEVVGQCADSAEALELCARASVDIVATDLQPSSCDAIELIGAVAASYEGIRTLVLASAADWRVAPAIASGASGFLLTDADPDAIRAAVLSLQLGNQVLCRQAVERLLADTRTTLTRREAEVLRMVAQGADNREIAGLLQLGEKTVRNYVSRLYRKLAVHNRAQVAMYLVANEFRGSAGVPAEEATR